MRPTAHGLGCALLAALALGCSKKSEPVVPVPLPPLGGPDAPLGGRSDATAAEDPELVALAKAKGWTLWQETREPDGKTGLLLRVSSDDPASGKAKLTENEYKVIAKAKAVKMLNLLNAECSDANLSALGGNASFEGIVVNGTGRVGGKSSVTDAGMKALARCKALDNVALVGTGDVTDAGLKELTALPNLRFLSIESNKITDAGIKELAAVPGLRYLRIDSDSVDGSGFAALAGCKALATVSVSGGGLTDAGLKLLGALPGLTDLSAGGVPGKLTTAGVKAFAAGRVPPRFSFAEELLDDELLTALVAKGWLCGPVTLRTVDGGPATAADVWWIKIDGSKVTDKGFAAVLNCTNATDLSVSRTGITDEALKKLSALTKLETVRLANTAVTSAGLKALVGVPSLKSLDVSGTALDDATFQELLKLPRLEQIDVTGTKVTKAALEKAKREHPKVRITGSDA